MNPFAKKKKEKEKVTIPTKSEVLQRIADSKIDAETLFYLIEFAERFPKGMISFETGLAQAKSNVNNQIEVVKK